MTTKQQQRAWRKFRLQQVMYLRGNIQNVRAMMIASVYPSYYIKGRRYVGGFMSKYQDKIADGTKKKDLFWMKKKWRKQLMNLRQYNKLEMLEVIP